MQSLDNVKGIGPKSLQLLSHLNIYTMEDLLGYYPYRFEILEKSNLKEMNQDDKVIVDGIIESIPNVYFFSKKLNKMSFRFSTENTLLNVTIFNRAFFKSHLQVGTKVTILGKYDKKHGTVVASEIRLGLLPPIPVIEPVYHTTSGISSTQLHKWILSCLDDIQSVEEYVPKYLCERYKLLDKKSSIKEVHNPKNKSSLNQALNYIKYEELFLFMMKMNCLKKTRNQEIGIERKISKEELESFISTLPFSLTEDQLKCVSIIREEMNKPMVMKRLIQGDVGSGKTIVAIIALYINYKSGYQGAFMAPTEILALQHYQNLLKLYKNTSIKVELLTGKMKAKERKEILQKLSRKEVDIIVGTHSLFSEDVIYDSLGLVITDEQHRFGVAQRARLKEKGHHADVLYLSATPIPRTYAITLYGDMDVSSIHTKPTGRKEVITELYKEKDVKIVLDKIQKEIREGHQVYVIAAQIEESEEDNLENVTKLKDKFEKALGKICKVGMLHGKMKAEEKDAVMSLFQRNEIQILISTTVIEVGIDVANATMMVIFDSYRFGLSQLHQLRGRVGRGDSQSYCILISDREVERLKVMTSTSDGFKISEEDFRLRGSGDLFGTRQSGDMNFGLADIKRDYTILLRAKEDSLEVLNSKEYQDGKYFPLREMIEKSIDLD